MTISRMLQPRQQYGLGSLVKSIGKGVKKFVKSPFGKAAILGLGGYALGGGFGPGGFAFKNIPGFTGAANLFKGKGKWGIGGGLAAFLLSQGMGEEEVSSLSQDPEKLRKYLRLYHSQTNPLKGDKEVDEWVEQNMASGGRVGLSRGTPNGNGIANLDVDEEIITPNDLIMEEGINIGPQVSSEKEIEGQTAGGGDRGWKAQMLAEDLAQEEYGKDFYDLSNDKQMEIYTIALDMIDSRGMAQGGRIGYESGTKPYTFEDFKKEKGLVDQWMGEEELLKLWERLKRERQVAEEKTLAAQGGRIGLYGGDKAQAAGIMGQLPVRQNKAGVSELDLRDTGGFIPPVGVKEKADDVPAMLSNNEFVWTADAVRAAGGGSVDKGAQILYDQMKKLENRVA